MAATNPLTQADLVKINTALQLIADARDLLRRMSACGVDCQAWNFAADDLQAKLMAIRQNFFGAPSR
jgi:hypothetical protein